MSANGRRTNCSQRSLRSRPRPQGPTRTVGRLPERYSDKRAADHLRPGIDGQRAEAQRRAGEPQRVLDHRDGGTDRLLAADQLGATRDGIRDDSDLAAYLTAFEAIDADPAHILAVAEAAGQVIGTMQLSFLPGLARRGSLRAQIEAVRVAADMRGSGLGAAMMAWATDEARRRGCALIQLTSDKSRTDAHRFYLRLGFVPSHEGMKLAL